LDGRLGIGADGKAPYDVEIFVASISHARRDHPAAWKKRQHKQAMGEKRGFQTTRFAASGAREHHLSATRTMFAAVMLLHPKSFLQRTAVRFYAVVARLVRSYGFHAATSCPPSHPRPSHKYPSPCIVSHGGKCCLAIVDAMHQRGGAEDHGKGRKGTRHMHGFFLFALVTSTTRLDLKSENLRYADRPTNLDHGSPALCSRLRLQPAGSRLGKSRA
jgi:hypothetical protein